MLRLKGLRYFIILFLFYVRLLAQTVPGTVSSNTTVCSGNNNGTLILTGYTGNIIRWEYSLTGFNPWTPIANTSSSLAYTNLMESVYYRVIVQAVGFPEAPSNSVCIKVDPTSAGGNTSANAVECTGNTIVVNLSTYVGNITMWQYSLSNGVGWNNIPSTSDSTTIHFPTVSSNTWFRAIVKSGVCPITYSDTAMVSVAPVSVGGDIGGTNNVCATLNTGTLTLSGNVGAVVRWESSLSGHMPWNLINNANINLYFSNLTQTTFFRAIVKSGNCTETPSTVFQVNVSAPSVGGTIIGSQAVCEANNDGTLQLLGYAGSIQQWEYSDNAGGIWNVIANNNALQSFSHLVQTRLYRSLVQNGSCGSVYSDTYTLTVNPLPDIVFSMNDACMKSLVTYTNTTTGSNLYNWDFGDGNGSLIKNPTHNYTSAGVFSVKLSVTSSKGCIDSLRKNSIVYPLPVPAYTSLNSICKNNAITFNNISGISSGSINSYLWKFNDGSSNSSLINPVHSFSTSGTYAVMLITTSNEACQDSVFHSIEVHPLPAADFSTSNVCKGDKASFANLSAVEDGYLNYTWSFGDGKNSVLFSPDHLYNNASTYNVMLVATSNYNCKNALIKPIVVNPTPSVNIVASNSCLGNAIAFSQQIMPVLNSPLISWNMGDGDTYTMSSPIHTYQAPGTYLVTLKITSDSGCGTITSQNISVYPLPHTNYLFDNACAADSVYFVNASSISSGMLSSHWYFGNGTESITENAHQYYENSGNYDVKLLSVSTYGCKDSITKIVNIFDAPRADFNFADVCDGEPVKFSNTSNINNGNIASYLWNFGDNSNSTIVNPSKQYLNYGTYSVSLVALSGNGCTDTTMKAVHVYEGAIANFSANDECIDNPVSFNNGTMLNKGTYACSWQFGDGTMADINFPVHSYTLSGVFETRLKVTTEEGCVDSVLKLVEIYPKPLVNAGFDTTIERGFGIRLNASGANEYAWYPVEGLDNPLMAHPFADPETSTTYIVEGKDIHGCSNTDTVKVSLQFNTIVMPYNIITPNGNGKNDTWVIENIETYPDNRLLIMDEWGTKVYEKKSYNNEWAGKNSTGEILPDATYYYILSFTNTQKTYTGYITLMRDQ